MFLCYVKDLFDKLKMPTLELCSISNKEIMMKLFLGFLLSAFLWTGAIAHADGLGFFLGPFSLQFGGEVNGPTVFSDGMSSDPICRAIVTQKQLELIAEMKENISDKEFKMVIKRITIEPYLFGMDNRHQPVLKGKIIEEKMIKEVTVKYGEESSESEKNLSGTFQIEKSKGDVSTLNVNRIQRIAVIEDSHFSIPKNYDKNSYNDVVNVICEVGGSH